MKCGSKDILAQGQHTDAVSKAGLAATLGDWSVPNSAGFESTKDVRLREPWRVGEAWCHVAGTLSA